MVSGDRVVVSRWPRSLVRLWTGGNPSPAGELARELDQPGAVASEELDEEIAAEPWAVIAVLVALTGLVWVFTSLATPVGLSAIAATAAGSLLLRLSLTAELSPDGPFEVPYSSGWWLALVGCPAVVVVNATGLFGSRAPPRASAEPAAARHPPQRPASLRGSDGRPPAGQRDDVVASSEPPEPTRSVSERPAEPDAGLSGATRFCSACGSRFVADARFCGGCATPRNGSGHRRAVGGDR